MRCPECQANIADGSIFCPVCAQMIASPKIGEEPLVESSGDTVFELEVERQTPDGYTPTLNEVLIDGELKAEPEVEVDIEDRAEAEAELEPEFEATPEAEGDNELAAGVEAEPKLVADVEPDTEPEVEAVDDVEPEADVELEPEVEEADEPEVEVAGEAESEPEPEPEADSRTELKAGTNPYAEADDMVASPIPAARVNPHDGKKPKRSWQFYVVMAALAALAAFVGVTGGRMRAEDAARYEAAHRPSRVVIDLHLPDTGDDELSPIPVRVVGNDVDGKALSELKMLSPSDRTFEIIPGEYELSPAGMIATASGRVFESESASAKVSCAPDQLAESEGVVVPSFVYREVPAEDLTDEDIESIYTWMTEANLGSDMADSYRTAIETARTNRLQQIEQDADEKKKLEEKKKQEEEQKKEKDAREQALEDNPEVVVAGAPDSPNRVSLTGTLMREDHDPNLELEPFTAYYLMLPKPITFDCTSGDAGTVFDVTICEVLKLEYGETDPTLEDLLGQTVTIEGSVFSTSSLDEHLGYAGLYDIAVAETY